MHQTTAQSSPAAKIQCGIPKQRRLAAPFSHSVFNKSDHAKLKEIITVVAYHVAKNMVLVNMVQKTRF